MGRCGTCLPPQLTVNVGNVVPLGAIVDAASGCLCSSFLDCISVAKGAAGVLFLERQGSNDYDADNVLAPATKEVKEINARRQAKAPLLHARHGRVVAEEALDTQVGNGNMLLHGRRGIDAL